MKWIIKTMSIMLLSIILINPATVMGPALPKAQTDFGGGNDAIEVLFTKEGSKTIYIPVYSNASYDHCTFDIEGKPWNGKYPTNISIYMGEDIRQGAHFGDTLGKITKLGTGEEHYKYDFTGETKYNNMNYFSIPTGANIVSASMNVTPKGGYTEALFYNMGEITLMAGVEDEMWFASSAEMLMRRHVLTDNVNVFTNFDGLNNTVISALAVDEDFVYAGSATTGATIFDRKKNSFSSHRWDMENGLGTNDIRYLHSDGEWVFIATDIAVFVFNKFGEFGSIVDSWTEDPYGLVSLDINDIETIGSLVFVGTSQGVSIYDRGSAQWTNLNRNSGLISNVVVDMVVDDDLLYVGTDQGISRYRYSTRQFLPVIDSNELPSRTVRALTQNDTSIFAMCRSGGFDSITKLSKATGESDGNTWYKENTDINDDKFNEVLHYKEYIYITTPTGLYRGEFPEGEFSFFPLSNNQIIANSVNDVCYDPDERIIYMLSDEGVARFDERKQLYLEPWNRDTGLADDEAVTMLAYDSILYIGTADAGVSRWSKDTNRWKDTINRFTQPNALASNKIQSLSIYNDILYIGHEKGVDRYNVETELLLDPALYPRWDYKTFNATFDEGVLINDIEADDEYVYIAHSPVYNNQQAKVSEGGLWVNNRTDPEIWMFFDRASLVGGNLSHDDVLSLEQNNTHLFIGTGNGLSIMNKRTYNVTIINYTNEPAFEGGPINEMYFQNSTTPHLYMLTGPVYNESLGYEVGGGLIVMETDPFLVLGQRNRTSTENIMTSDDLNSMDMQGNVLLIGSADGGVIRFNLEGMELLDPSQSLGEKQFPCDVTIDLGDDGELERVIDIFNIPINLDLSNRMNLLMYYATQSVINEEGIEFSIIPINVTINPDSMGIIMISDFVIEYEYQFTADDFSSAVNTYIESLDHDPVDNIVDLPVRIESDSPGIVILKDPLMLYRFSNPPIVNISSPVPYSTGTEYWDSIAIDFDASGTYDPDKEPLEYLWTSDIDPTFRGTSKKLSAILKEGLHNITLTITDPTGKNATDNVIINVRGNLPPLAVISAPLHNETFFTGVPVTFAADGSNDENGDTLIYYWYVNDWPVGQGETFEYSFEKTGLITILLRVSDGSLTNSTSIVVNIQYSNVETISQEKNSRTMFDTNISYTIIHSNYSFSKIDIEPMEINEIEANLSDLKKTNLTQNLTHIGIAFSLKEVTLGTVYEEVLKINYTGQEDFLENIRIDSLGVYYLALITEEEGFHSEWIFCPTIEHNKEEMYIVCRVPQEWRKRGEEDTFVLLGNKTNWTENAFKIESVSFSGKEVEDYLDEARNVDPIDLIITIEFSNEIINRTIDVVVENENGNPEAMYSPPYYYRMDKSITFRMTNLSNDSKYTIKINFVMDVYRDTIVGFNIHFRTRDVEKEKESSFWLWIIIGIVLVLIIAALVYFFVVRRGEFKEEDVEEEVLSCPRCGVVIIGEDVEECPECEFELQKKAETVVKIEFISCPVCDAKIDGRSKICPFCSKALVKEEEEDVEEEIEEEPEPTAADMGVSEDVECPTCGTMVEKGMTECPACGEMEFGL